MADSRRDSARVGVNPVELVTSAFEVLGAVLVVAGLGWQAAVFAGGPVGLLVAGLGAVAASWVFTGGPARVAAARAARRAEREKAARSEEHTSNSSHEFVSRMPSSA